MTYYEDKLTDAQKAVFADFNQHSKAEVDLCIEKMTLAVNAIVPLPHVNEQGNKVIHGCNMAMRGIANYWYERLATLQRLLPHKEFYQYTNNQEASTIYKQLYEKD